MEDTPRVKQWKEWVGTNVRNGMLTQRDLEWIGSEPSPWIQYFPIVGGILGLTAAGIASRVRMSSTLRTWGFSRTIATATAASGLGYIMGSQLSDRSLYRFERNTDSPVLARIAKLKRDHAIVRDAAERAQEQLGSSNERQAQNIQDALEALENTFNDAVETVLLMSLVPEDVQVHNASAEEIKNAVQSIIQESMDEDGLELSEHDINLLISNEVECWQNRSIEPVGNPALPAGTIVGALGIYGRLLRRSPIHWRWLVLSFFPLYFASFLHGLGFGTFARGKRPDDWLVYQLAGMEVRAEIAEKIALDRARFLIQNTLSKGDDVDLLPQSARLLGSASPGVSIQFPFRQSASLSSLDLTGGESTESNPVVTTRTQ